MRIFIAAVTAALVSACGGGSSADTVDLSGLYLGEFQSIGAPEVDLAGAISTTGALRMVSFGGERIYGGRLAGETTNFSGSLAAYDIYYSNSYAVFGVRSDDGQVVGAADDFGVLGGTFQTSRSGQVGRFSLEPLTLSETSPATVEDFEGIWGNADTSAGDSAGFVIERSGAFSGSDSDGCNFTGRIRPEREDIGLFRISLNGACPGEGAFSGDGLLVYIADPIEPPVFIAFITGAELAIVIELEQG